jgi:hypothetical protein
MTVKDVELFVKFFINNCTWHTKLSSFQTLSKQMFDSLAKKKDGRIQNTCVNKFGFGFKGSYTDFKGIWSRGPT